MPRYFALSTYIRQRYGKRVQKIPLDAGFDCPNRDGTLSFQGCAFCSPQGSGTGLAATGQTLEQQWAHWSSRLFARYKTRSFWAYLQSFSNTHGPVEKLREVLERIAELPGLEGICCGTRPDCLDRDKLQLLAEQPVREIWLELGLQSCSDQTLALINRGHDSRTFARAAAQAADMGLKVCAHVIAGLPGEGPDAFLQTIDFVNGLPVAGIKIHNLYVCRGTALARWWGEGSYRPLDRDVYLGLLVRSLARLRPDIVIHRLNSDPQPGELLAPGWAADKQGLLEELAARLESRDIRQGQDLLNRRSSLTKPL